MIKQISASMDCPNCQKRMIFYIDNDDSKGPKGISESITYHCDNNCIKYNYQATELYGRLIEISFDVIHDKKPFHIVVKPVHGITTILSEDFTFSSIKESNIISPQNWESNLTTIINFS
jgi:hypothetical protein